MKRILFLTFYFRPDLCAGSFRNSPLLDELSRQTKDEDILIDVYTTQPNRYASYSKKAAASEKFDNVKVERIDIPAHKSGIIDQALSFKTYFFETLRRTRQTEYDLVYGSSSRFFTSYLAFRIARRKNTPLYVDVRDIFSETIFHISKNPAIKYLFTPFVKHLEKRVYSYASHINLISEGFKESFNRFKNAKVSYYTHGIDPIFLEKPEQVLERGPSSKKKILYAGNVGEGQGLHHAIPEAAKALEENYEFEIIGDGGALHKLKNAIAEIQVTNVNIMDPVRRDGLLTKYHEADILLIHLNDHETFKKVLPSKVFELTVTGKPILAGVSGFTELFLQEHVPQAVVFEPCNPNSLIKAIHKIASEGSKSFSEIEKRSFIEKFSRNQVNQKIVKTIKNNIKKS